MANPVSAEYSYVKIAFKTNAKAADAGAAMSVSLTKDNTFNWQAKYFDVTSYGYWSGKSGVTEDAVVFNMTDKLAEHGVKNLEFFRFIPFNGQIVAFEGDTLNIDIEYIAFFKTEKAAEGFSL